jgi:hypothetical protein
MKVRRISLQIFDNNYNLAMFEILKEPKVLLFHEKIEAKIPALLYCLYTIYCLFRGKSSVHKQLIPA